MHSDCRLDFFFLIIIDFFFLNYQLLNPGSYLCEGGRDSFHQKRDEQSKTLSMWNHIGLILVLRERRNLRDDTYHLHFKAHEYFCFHIFWNNFVSLSPDVSIPLLQSLSLAFSFLLFFQLLKSPLTSFSSFLFSQAELSHKSCPQ